MKFTRKNLIKRMMDLIEGFERDLDFSLKFEKSYYQIQAQKAKAKINAYTWLVWEIEHWEDLHN